MVQPQRRDEAVSAGVMDVVDVQPVAGLGPVRAVRIEAGVGEPGPLATILDALVPPDRLTAEKTPLLEVELEDRIRSRST